MAMAQEPRKVSYAVEGDRKPSLRELPSYRDEASKAMNRRDDLKSLSKRLSSNRDLLNADLSTKPWLKFRSISRPGNMSLEKVREDANAAFPIDEGTFTATPATITPANEEAASSRSRNFSRGSSDQSENSLMNDSFNSSTSNNE